jgi:enamine deaminase RidA (YjgF/YER057c/UK114 family)
VTEKKNKTRRVVQPFSWARPKGYANGILTEGGRLLFIAGQVGWDPTSPTPTFPKTFAEQFEKALDNVLTIVREAGGAPSDLARMTFYVTSRPAYVAATKTVGTIWRSKVGDTYPAMTLVEVSALLEPDAQVEIEATAVL